MKNWTSLFRNFAIICFVIGIALQFYNYSTFKKYHWSLIKQKIDLTNATTHTFELRPNLDTTFEIILFYKKFLAQEGSIFDQGLEIKALVKDGQNTIWQQQHMPTSNFTATLKGTEVVIGGLELSGSKKYFLELDVITPTSLKGQEIVLSVVANQKLFKEYFKKAGIFELFSYAFLIMSFLFFIGFIIAPHDSKQKKQADLSAN